MRTVSTVDVVLQSIEERIRFRAPHGEIPAIEEILHGNDPHVDEIVTISFNNVAGVGVVNSNLEVSTGRSYADAEFFRVHVKNPNYGAFIGSPFVGPASGKRVFVISRRVTSAQGNFLGTLVASVSTDVLATKFAAERIGQQGLIGLFHVPSRKTMVRQPDYEGTFGKTLTPSRLFDELSKAPTGAYEADSAFDDEKRLFVYRQVTGTPLAVTVGISMTEIKARLKDELRGSWIVLSILALAMAMATALILAAHRRQKMVQDALDTTKNRYLTLSGVSTVGVFHADPVGEYLYINDQWSKIAGLSLDAALGKGWLSAVHPDDAARVRQAWQQSTSGLTPFNCEYRFLRANGEARWVLAQASKEINAQELVTGYTGTVTDFTERRLADQEQRIAAVAFGSQDGTVVTDANNVILRANDAFCKETGYSAEEIVGQTPNLLKSGRHDAAFYREMWESIKRTGGWKGEIWDRRKNGEVYPKSLTISVVRDENGAITHYIGTQHDITERKLAEERIKELAFFDPLTGLPNRVTLHEKLSQVLKLAARSNDQFAVMLIDLDNFKTINDTLGHQAGDDLLVQVAERLSVAVRQSDLVARLGGDEFVIVLPDIDGPTAAAHVAEKILVAVSAPYFVAEKALRTSPSIGICLYPDDATDSEDLIKKADVAMYHAKSSGRRNYQFFTEHIQAAAVERLAIEADLRTALEKQQFVLHYQPQLDLRTGRLVGVEALIRWEHPVRGMVSPLDFIPIAEECGLILPIGAWVLGEACRQQAVWRAAGIEHIKMSVNLAASQFADQNLPTQIQAILEKTGIPATSLDLEVTESMTMKSPDGAAAMMRVLTGQQLSLSIDDFGTGYSSLAYLKLFPISTLKIDRSFVKDIETYQNDADICDVTVLLAHKLGMNVVAEGVETEGQLKYLHSIGCEKIQGYLISRPLPSNKAEEFIRDHKIMGGLGTVDLWNASP